MTKPFQTALETCDLAALRECPKADLHVHSIGGGNREFLRGRTGRDIAPVQGVLRSMDEMHVWSDTHLADLFAGTTGRALAFEATFVQALRDGVTLIETGEDVWAITLCKGSALRVWQEQVPRMREARQRCDGSRRWGFRGIARSAPSKPG